MRTATQPLARVAIRFVIPPLTERSPQVARKAQHLDGAFGRIRIGYLIVKLLLNSLIVTLKVRMTEMGRVR
jgi:hypothetical protein